MPWHFISQLLQIKYVARNRIFWLRLRLRLGARAQVGVEAFAAYLRRAVKCTGKVSQESGKKKRKRRRKRKKRL